MSWLARSIANSLKLDDYDDGDDEPDTSTVAATHPNSPPKSEPKPKSVGEAGDTFSSDGLSPQGVKEDLSQLTKTLTRQFWGVASFLAPPPSDPVQDQYSGEPSDQEDDSETPGIAGIRSDLSEIGGKFRTGISMLSSHKAVSEITKIASNILQFGSAEGYTDRGVLGLTEEVLAFVKDVAMHPETWLDFPLPDDEEIEDFDMSDAQQEHALAVEHLVPELAALRIELCPGYMSEGSFWRIYFVLLHPRLTKQDAELLSTSQVMEARAMLAHELKKRTNGKPAEQEDPSEVVGLSSNQTPSPSNEEILSVPSRPQSQPPVSTERTADVETEKHPVSHIEIRFVDKSVVSEGPDGTRLCSGVGKYEDEGDDWLKEENSEIGGTSIPIENEEDVSFSDLEDDDDGASGSGGGAPVTQKKLESISGSSDRDSRDWVQLGRSSVDSQKDANSADGEHGGRVRDRNPEIRESNDWLDVEEIDVM